MNFHSDFYCFTIYNCRGQLPIFKQRCSLAVQLKTSKLLFQVSPNAQFLTYLLQSSSGSLKCTFVNDLRPNLVIQVKKKVLTFYIWGFTYIYKYTKTFLLTIELGNQIYFDNGHVTRTTVTKAFTIVQKTTWSKWIRHPCCLRPRNRDSNPCVFHDKTITERLSYIRQFRLYRKNVLLVLSVFVVLSLQRLNVSKVNNFR